MEDEVEWSMQPDLMQPDLWGNPVVKSDEYCVFHDESESKPDKRWLLIGLLFVHARKVEEVRQVLARHRENYDGEIHFSELPRSFRGEYGAKARVARRWMMAYQDCLCEEAYFSCLAVDRRSPAYEHKRFTRDFHAYNRFTAMALKAGITWNLGRYDLDKLHIRFVSDAKDRATRPDKGMIDNFDAYLPYRAALDSFLAQRKGKRYPYVNMELILEDSAREDLLQLTDLLLGATQMALAAGSSRETKRELGARVVRWCQDLRKQPRKQEFQMYRRYNLWAFPNHEGCPYNHVPLSLKVEDGQQRLY